MSGKRISRRTVLRGVGTAMALPLLEAMSPRVLRGAEASGQVRPPRRMAFFYVPNGAHMPDWTPAAEGANFELPPILAPLASFKDDLLVLSGLNCDKAWPNGDGPGDHARSSSAFLTGCQARKSGGSNFRSGVSADQLAAMRLGDRTRLPSLELGIERFRGAGVCDSGYACVYQHTLSWRSPTLPVPNEVDPKLVFERLFSDSPNDPDRQKRNRLRASVLDAVLDDAKRLDARLGGGDRQKLDQYLTCVRELEQRIAQADKLPPIEAPEDAERPAGVPAELGEHFRLISDLMVLAFETDVTRIGTFMFGSEGSNQRYKMIDISEGHHELSHHRNDPEMQAKISRINKFHVEQFAYLVGKLKAIPEGDGTLLDHCMLAYGSGIGDGNRHNHDELPILLVGRGGGTLKTGRHLRYADRPPLNNLWLSLLDRFGARTEKLGDSTGLLANLS